MKALLRKGDWVSVDVRIQPGHVRTPDYLKGKQGTIVEECGVHPNPEELATGGLGLPYRRLYRVMFRRDEVWPGEEEGSKDSLIVDIYEHWLHAAGKGRA